MSSHRIATRLTSLHHYFDQVRKDLSKTNLVQAMSDAAELQFQATALYKEITNFYHAQRTEPPSTQVPHDPETK